MNISQFQSINPRLRASYHQSSIKMDSTSTSDQLASINKIKDKMDLPDKVIENIQQMAREDAKKGIYKDDKYISYVNAYKEAHISPDRSKLMMMFQPMIMNARYTDGKPSFFSIQGFPGFTAKFTVGAVLGGYLSITDANGDQILSYTPPPNGGWQSGATREENAFLFKTSDIYDEVYDAVRAEMKATQNGTTKTNAIDISV